MASVDGHVDPVGHDGPNDPAAEGDDSVESVIGPLAVENTEGVEVDQEDANAANPNNPDGAPAAALPPEYAQILQIVLQTQANAHAQHLAQVHVPAHAPVDTAPVIDRNYERIRKMGATEFEGTLDAEISERWWEKTEDVMNLVNCTPENRLRYMVSLFTGDALTWWRSVKRAYEPQEMTWTDFQREFDDIKPKLKHQRKLEA